MFFTFETSISITVPNSETKQNIDYLKYSLLLLVLIIIFVGVFARTDIFLYLAESFNQEAAVAAAVSSPFHYYFSVDGVLEETGSMNYSSSPYWWLNSGGVFILKNGVGMTNQGELPFANRWRLAYALSSSVDTDGGYHPQNLFRLVTRSKWEDIRQSVDFKIVKDNFSQSPNRNQSNGVLFFTRYKDGNNLYYSGLRVDGAAVIKKKHNGIYYTLAYNKIYPGQYDISKNVDLIPHDVWMSIQSEVKTLPDGSVSIKLYKRDSLTSDWQLVAEAVDNGTIDGDSQITGSGYAGIRTDFMDILFDDYRVTTI